MLHTYTHSPDASQQMREAMVWYDHPEHPNSSRPAGLLCRRHGVSDELPVPVVQSAQNSHRLLVSLLLLHY